MAINAQLRYLTKQTLVSVKMLSIMKKVSRLAFSGVLKRTALTLL
ncbi:TPA: hypothetical protein ACVU5J_004846 [Vibrio parahaemolyticus]|nr:hypothetical protein AJ90_26310 [Vibrio parahaemolyticus M0605]